MTIPIEVVFHNMAHSAAVESSIHERAAKLERFGDMIKHLRVTVEAPPKQHNKGIMYHITIDITVPDVEIIVNHDPQLNHAHEDVYVAIHDAMNSARRQLEEYDMKRRGKVKTDRQASTLPGHLLD